MFIDASVSEATVRSNPQIAHTCTDYAADLSSSIAEEGAKVVDFLAGVHDALAAPKCERLSR